MLRAIRVNDLLRFRTDVNGWQGRTRGHAWVLNTMPTSFPQSFRLACSLISTALTGWSPPTPNPSSKRNATSTQNDGDSADPSARR